MVEVAAAGAGAEASGALAVAPEVGGSGAVGGRWRGDGRRPLIVAEEVDDVGWVWGRPPRGDGGLLFAPPGRGELSRWLLVAPGRGEESRRSPPGRGEAWAGAAHRPSRDRPRVKLWSATLAALRIVGERDRVCYQPTGPLHDLITPTPRLSPTTQHNMSDNRPQWMIDLAKKKAAASRLRTAGSGSGASATCCPQAGRPAAATTRQTPPPPQPATVAKPEPAYTANYEAKTPPASPPTKPAPLTKQPSSLKRRKSSLREMMDVEMVPAWTAFMEASEVGPTVRAYQTLRRSCKVPEGASGRVAFEAVKEATLVSQVPHKVSRVFTGASHAQQHTISFDLVTRHRPPHLSSLSCYICAAQVADGGPLQELEEPTNGGQ